MKRLITAISLAASLCALSAVPVNAGGRGGGFHGGFHAVFVSTADAASEAASGFQA
jgi:hypothetical protein